LGLKRCCQSCWVPAGRIPRWCRWETSRAAQLVAALPPALVIIIRVPVIPVPVRTWPRRTSRAFRMTSRRHGEIPGQPHGYIKAERRAPDPQNRERRPSDTFHPSPHAPPHGEPLTQNSPSIETSNEDTDV
jgi:hypothetical protein